MSCHSGCRKYAAFQQCWCCPTPPLLLPAAEINEALEAIGEISHAENMEYSSDAHSSLPATATQVLLTNLGVCVWGGWVGSTHLYWDHWHWHCCPLAGWPHLTLLFRYIYFKSLSVYLSFWSKLEISFFHSPPKPCLVLTLSFQSLSRR